MKELRDEGFTSLLDLYLIRLCLYYTDTYILAGVEI